MVKVKEVGARIRQLRKTAGMTQQDLAERMRAIGYSGASRVTITKWEGGKQKPTITMARALQRIFGVSVDYLLSGVDDMPINSLERKLLITTRKNPKLLALVDCAAELNDKDFDTVIRMACAMRRIEKEAN